MKVTILSLDFKNIILRYYLMMTVVLIAGFSGMWALGLLALPIFISSILSISFTKTKLKSASKIIDLPVPEKLRKAS